MSALILPSDLHSPQLGASITGVSVTRSITALNLTASHSLDKVLGGLDTRAPLMLLPPGAARQSKEMTPLGSSLDPHSKVTLALNTHCTRNIDARSIASEPSFWSCTDDSPPDDTLLADKTSAPTDPSAPGTPAAKGPTERDPANERWLLILRPVPQRRNSPRLSRLRLNRRSSLRRRLANPITRPKKARPKSHVINRRSCLR